MQEVTHSIGGRAELEKLWRQGIRHGALLLPFHPPPAGGERVGVTLKIGFAGTSLRFEGVVAQASAGVTVVQLDPLSEGTRAALGALGFGEAVTNWEIASVPPAKSEASMPAVASPVVSPAGPGSAPPPPDAPAPAPVRVAPPAPTPFRPAAAAFSPRPAAPQVRPSPTQPPPSPSPLAGPPTLGSMPAATITAGGTQGTDSRLLAVATGPADPRTEALLPPATAHGDLSRFSWRDALLHFLKERVTGVLIVDGFKEVRWGYFVDGSPVHYLGNAAHPGEYLSDALVASGAVTQEAWLDAVLLQKVTGIQAGQLLIARGALRQGQLDEALTRRAERITRNLLGANFGRFRFRPFPEVRGVFTQRPVDVLRLLWETQMDLLRQASDEALVLKAEDLYPLRVRIVPERADLLGLLPMVEYQAHAARELLPAAWTLKELVALGEIEERDLLRLLFALDAMGCVEFVHPVDEDNKSRRAQRILYEGWKDLSRRDPFTAVHAHWSSNVAEIEEGYARLCKEYHRDRFLDVLDPRVEELLTRITELGARAHDKLKTRDGRKEARKGIVGNDQLRMASDLLDKQGEMAVYKSDFPLVRMIYEKVLELEPGGPEGVENVARAKKVLADPAVANATTAGISDRDLRRRMDAIVGTVGRDEGEGSLM